MKEFAFIPMCAFERSEKGMGFIMKKRYSKGDVEWCFPNTKKPFAYSTISTSDLIEALSEQYLTTKDVYDSINYDSEAKDIVKKFIDKGYGNYLLRDFVHKNPNLIYRKIENNEIISVKNEELKKHLDMPEIDYTDYEI